MHSLISWGLMSINYISFVCSSIISYVHKREDTYIILLGCGWGRSSKTISEPAHVPPSQLLLHSATTTSLYDLRPLPWKLCTDPPFLYTVSHELAYYHSDGSPPPQTPSALKLLPPPKPPSHLLGVQVTEERKPSIPSMPQWNVNYINQSSVLGEDFSNIISSKLSVQSTDEDRKQSLHPQPLLQWWISLSLSLMF